ncbi:MAG: prolyl oligopeptidase family serine peptidase [Bacteroidetes bacterium]|nr:prolyl oligopeptidase family serine peptidase [Bacteroidota bacterium]
MSEDFILNVQNNNVLRITAFGIENIDNAPCLIFVHGFKGFKDWGFGPFIGDYFSKKRFFVLTFNFSHNGVGDNLTDFVELDKFANNTFSLEMDELKELILAYDFGFFGNTSKQGIGLIGHSRGGAISLLVGSESDDVKAVCTWSAVSNFNRYTNRQKDEWREKGFIEILNTRTKQKMRLNVSLLEDIENNKEGSLNIEQAVKNMNKPLLIVQGKNDLAVPVNEAEKLYDTSNKELTELLIIPTAGHTFDVKHPFDGSNNKFDTVLDNTNKFFETNLN